MNPLRRTVGTAVALVVCGALAAGCEGMMLGGGNDNTPLPAVCEHAAPGRHVLGTQFAMSGPIDGKIRTFVQAANDVAGAAAQAEDEVAQACYRIGLDLGVPPANMSPRAEKGGRASGACLAASIALDAVMRQGAAVHVRVTPPLCTPNLMAQSQCTSACSANPNDAECLASCRVHANVTASCTPPLVVVTPAIGANALAFRLAGTLQANLPNLLHAELVLGRRLMQEAQIVRQVGGNVPRMIGQPGALATGCVYGANEEAAAAAFQLDTVVRASFSITGRVGATSG
jgi:hypothetical protein